MLHVLLFFLSPETIYVYEVVPFDTLYECRQALENEYSGYDGHCSVITDETYNSLLKLAQEIPNDR